MQRKQGRGKRGEGRKRERIGKVGKQRRGAGTRRRREGERMREGERKERRGTGTPTYSTLLYHSAQVPTLWIKEELRK